MGSYLVFWFNKFQKLPPKSYLIISIVSSISQQNSLKYVSNYEEI